MLSIVITDGKSMILYITGHSNNIFETIAMTDSTVSDKFRNDFVF